MKVLFVLTSHREVGNSGRKTGFWLSEFTDPYYIFLERGAQITLASPQGGQPTVNPTSRADKYQTDETRRFDSDPRAQAELANTVKLTDLRPDDFDAVFFPGGHGPVWDLAEDESVIKLIEVMSAARKPIGAVCHGLAVLRHPKTANGVPLVSGRKVTGFSNSEEEKAGIPKLMPFLVEDMLRNNGGLYGRAEDWAPFVVVDGNLVTGQNPASSRGVTEQMLKLLASDSSKLEKNKAVVVRWFTDFWGPKVNLNVVEEIAAPDMLLQYSLHKPRRGHADIKAFMTDFRAAFPDLSFGATADLIAEGDYVVGQWKGGGTHTGPAFSDFLVGSLPAASGRKMHFTGTTVLKVVNGKILEEIGLDDGVTALTQLGLIKSA